MRLRQPVAGSVEREHDPVTLAELPEGDGPVGLQRPRSRPRCDERNHLLRITLGDGPRPLLLATASLHESLLAAMTTGQRGDAVASFSTVSDNREIEGRRPAKMRTNIPEIQVPAGGRANPSRTRSTCSIFGQVARGTETASK